MWSLYGSLFRGGYTVRSPTTKLTCRKGMTNCATSTGNTKGATGNKPAPPLRSMCSAWLAVACEFIEKFVF